MVIEFICKGIKNESLVKSVDYDRREIRSLYGSTFQFQPIERPILKIRKKAQIILSCVFFDILVMEFRSEYAKKCVEFDDLHLASNSPSKTEIICRMWLKDGDGSEIELSVINGDKSKGYKTNPKYEEVLTQTLFNTSKDEPKIKWNHTGADKPIGRMIMHQVCKVLPSRKPMAVTKKIKSKPAKQKKA